MSTLRTMSSWQRCYFDFIRAAASQMVLVGHAAAYFLAPGFLNRGDVQGLGVMMLFLISGFLISHCILDNWNNPEYGFRSYFLDRFFRIYTAYLPALVLVAIVDRFSIASPLFEYASGYKVQNWIGNLLMLQDQPVFQVLRRLNVEEQPWFITVFGSARPFWTLSIEWWIYMLFGGVMFFCVRRTSPLKKWQLVAIAFFAIVPLYHFVGGYAEILIYLWLMGLGATLAEQRWLKGSTVPGALSSRRFVASSLAIGSAALIGVMMRAVGRGGDIGNLQFAIFLAVMVFSIYLALGASPRPVPRVVEKIVTGIAHYSYSLYLTHNTVIVLAASLYFRTGDNPTAFLIVVLASHVVAIMFWFLFECHYKTLGRMARQVLEKRRFSIQVIRQAALSPFVRHGPTPID